MLEASTRPAMVPGWRRRWPAWSPCAAMAWSVLYGALALSWGAGAPGFPFGEGDPPGRGQGFRAGFAGGALAAAGAALAALLLSSTTSRRHASAARVSRAVEVSR